MLEPTILTNKINNQLIIRVLKCVNLYFRKGFKIAEKVYLHGFL